MPDIDDHNVEFEIQNDRFDELYFHCRTAPFQRDNRLTLQAKGLLATLVSFGKGWRIFMRDIQKRSSSGRTVLRKACKELIEAGYLEKHAKKGERGRFCGWIYRVYQTPQLPQNEQNQGVDGTTSLRKLREAETPCNGKTVARKNRRMVDDKHKQNINNNNLKQQQCDVVASSPSAEDTDVKEKVIAELEAIGIEKLTTTKHIKTFGLVAVQRQIINVKKAIARGQINDKPVRSAGALLSIALKDNYPEYDEYQKKQAETKAVAAAKASAIKELKEQELEVAALEQTKEIQDPDFKKFLANLATKRSLP